MVVQGRTGDDCSPAAAHQGLGPGAPLNGSIEYAVRKDTVAFVVAKDLQNSSACPGHLTSLLIVIEKEEPVLPNWTANHATELMPLQLRLCSPAEPAVRIHSLVAIELEYVPMDPVRPGLCDAVHDGAGELAVLRTEAVGQQAKLGDRIGVGNQPRPHVLGLIHLGAVDQEGVGIFRLTIGRNVARRRVEAGSRAAIVEAAVRIDRGDTSLQGEKINVGTTVEGHGQNLIRFDCGAQLRAGGLNLLRVRLNFDGRSDAAHLKREIEMQLIIYVKVDVFDHPLLETGDRRIQGVAPGRQGKNTVLTGCVSHHCPGVARVHLNHGDVSLGENRTRFVANIARDGSGHVCPQLHSAEKYDHTETCVTETSEFHVKPPQGCCNARLFVLQY